MATNSAAETQQGFSLGKDINMEITPLELGLAAAAVAIIFGPKRLPRKKQATTPEQVDLQSIVPPNYTTSYGSGSYAAGRAPSPLATRSAPARYEAEREYSFNGSAQQYKRASRLPHEF